MLELGILTYPHITVMLGQRLEKTVLAYRSHLNISIPVVTSGYATKPQYN